MQETVKKVIYKWI